MPRIDDVLMDATTRVSRSGGSGPVRQWGRVRRSLPSWQSRIRTLPGRLEIHRPSQTRHAGLGPYGR
jgi:hypothetical protein